MVEVEGSGAEGGEFPMQVRGWGSLSLGAEKDREQNRANQRVDLVVLWFSRVS